MPIRYRTVCDLMERALDMVHANNVSMPDELTVAIDGIDKESGYGHRIVKYLYNVRANQHATWGYAVDGSRLIVRYVK